MAIFNTVYGGELKQRATQWPSPKGFHVPTKDELQSLYGYYTALWLSWSANFVKFLKIPKSWYRYPDNANPTSVWTTGIYLSCVRANANNASKMQINWNISFTYDIQVNFWCQIRPFKNTVKVPDSSRTVLYQSSWNAGIYHNSTLWLISISSNGTNWITIADKNLWATTVYNDWDTLSEANCGKYYQWGNNYGFPFTWSVTTSSTMVDASNYWPWNYYESSTFITASPRWDSTMNYNLRWWVDGNVPV